jgi:hypothetical protein
MVWSRHVEFEGKIKSTYKILISKLHGRNKLDDLELNVTLRLKIL